MSLFLKFLLVLVVWSLLLSTTEQQQASCADDVEFCGVDASSSIETLAESANNETAPANPNVLQDLDENCPAWADRGECENNPDYMLHFCKKSCQPYVDTIDQQMMDDEEEEEEEGETPEMAFGVKQTFLGYPEEELTRKTISAAIDYMNNVVWAHPEKYPEEIAKHCRNQDEFCAYWAATGVCKENPAYMNINCAPVCQACDQLDFKVRCPLDPNAKDTLESGDLHRMFERIINEKSILGLNLTVVSRPYVEGREGIYGLPLEEGQINGPWVVTFDNFVTDEEAGRMIQLGFDQGFERSADVGDVKFDGTLESVVNDDRTSTNAWCSGKCEEDPVSRAIWQRIEQITGIPEKNSEQFQILRYEEGQFYNLHHDYIQEDVDRPNGVRILTFFIYLSDVEEGGGTHFPQIGDHPGLTVMPKKGKAVLWPNVLNHSPSEWDPRTHHAALPIGKGLKYACNAWIHMRDFKTPHSVGCS